MIIGGHSCVGLGMHLPTVTEIIEVVWEPVAAFATCSLNTVVARTMVPRMSRSAGMNALRMVVVPLFVGVVGTPG
jgi:hypothetical protein